MRRIYLICGVTLPCVGIYLPAVGRWLFEPAEVCYFELRSALQKMSMDHRAPHRAMTNASDGGRTAQTCFLKKLRTP